MLIYKTDTKNPNWKDVREFLLNSKDVVIQKTIEFLGKLELPEFNEIYLPEMGLTQIQALKYQLDGFQEKKFYCDIDSEGCIHSNFTDLDPKVRTKVKIAKKPLVQVGVCACFPTLLLSWITDPKEYGKYTYWLYNSDFYRELISCDSRLQIAKLSERRNHAKNCFIGWLRGGQGYDFIGEILAREFPILHAKILSRGYLDNGDFGLLLNKIEGKIINDALQKLWMMSPSIPALSVRDAIYCHQENAEVVILSINRVFFKEIRPVIRTNFFHSQYFLSGPKEIISIPRNVAA